MQKKILSAVLALCLVGSASVALAGGDSYWQPNVNLSFEIEDELVDGDMQGSVLQIGSVYNNNSNKIEVPGAGYSDDEYYTPSNGGFSQIANGNQGAAAYSRGNPSKGVTATAITNLIDLSRTRTVPTLP